jgi:hypothetical protein
MEKHIGTRKEDALKKVFEAEKSFSSAGSSL